MVHRRPARIAHEEILERVGVPQSALTAANGVVIEIDAEEPILAKIPAVPAPPAWSTPPAAATPPGPAT